MSGIVGFSGGAEAALRQLGCNVDNTLGVSIPPFMGSFVLLLESHPRNPSTASMYSATASFRMLCPACAMCRRVRRPPRQSPAAATISPVTTASPPPAVNSSTSPSYPSQRAGPVDPTQSCGPERRSGSASIFARNQPGRSRSSHPGWEARPSARIRPAGQVCNFSARSRRNLGAWPGLHPGPVATPYAGSSRTSRVARDGCETASSCATRPPME